MRSARGHRGFTLVELVVVMVLMAVLTAVASARFASREPFAVQAGADQLISSLRLAQALAIAQRQTIHVVLGATPLSLMVCRDAACTQPIAPPGGDGAWLVEAGTLTLSSAATFSFDASGAPSFASALQLQVISSDGSATSPPLRVEPFSGHVRLL